MDINPTVEWIKLVTLVFQERVVRVHELMTWIEGEETPNNVDDFLELIHLVAVWEQERLASEEKVAAATMDSIMRRYVTVMCLWVEWFLISYEDGI